jgi:hypothetical protein
MAFDPAHANLKEDALFKNLKDKFPVYWAHLTSNFPDVKNAEIAHLLLTWMLIKEPGSGNHFPFSALKRGIYSGCTGKRLPPNNDVSRVFKELIKLGALAETETKRGQYFAICDHLLIMNHPRIMMKHGLHPCFRTRS